MKKILLGIVVMVSSTQGFAQMQQPMSAAEIQLALQKLNVCGSVLYIAAHPDDENTRLITYLANERKLRTGYLSITRGDGGQNLIGNEQGEALGLVRTNELLQARKVDGGEQFFTRANDFGYSKNPEETFQFWNKEKTLSDVVWVIRNFRPDVIICRFPTTGEGGHGHHTASAILAEEAFDAAADPNKFTDQLKYVSVWTTKRLFWNTFNFGGTNTTAPEQLKIDVGIYNPLLGKGYGEVASESRSMHKSQGFGSARSRGSQFEYFKQLKGEMAVADPFEGINQTWKRVDEKEKVTSIISQAINKFSPIKPSSIVNDLVAIYKSIAEMKSPDPEVAYWKKQKLKETEQLLVNCAGLWMEASTENYSYVPGDSIKLNFQGIARLDSTVQLLKITLGEQIIVVDSFAFNVLRTKTIKVKLSEETPVTNPYWLNQKHADGIYEVSDQQIIGMPLTPVSLLATFEWKINNQSFSFTRPALYKFTDPVKGEVYRPLEILPPVTINFSEKANIFKNGEKKKITCTIKSNVKSAKGKLDIVLPQAWKTEHSSLDFDLKNKGDEQVISFSVQPPSAKAEDVILKISSKVNGQVCNKSIRRIDYDHIPSQFILSDAETKLVNMELKTTTKRIGYIEGAGDDVAECLQQIGYNVVELTDEKLSNESLQQYDVIVAGIRAYNTHERLQVHYQKLMKYIEDGGNFLVQYNTNSRVGPVVAKIAPYPMTISRDRVTDETAAIKFINPSHTLLNTPNKITANDFKDWIQERGIYFATERDSNYTALLEMNDPGEKPLTGSLITATYGKGNFIYTGLAFFRELPAGVAGAYRLFVNLIEAKNESATKK